MNWKEFLGKENYERLKKRCEKDNISMAMAVRTAVIKLIERK